MGKVKCLIKYIIPFGDSFLERHEDYSGFRWYALKLKVWNNHHASFAVARPMGDSECYDQQMENWTSEGRWTQCPWDDLQQDLDMIRLQDWNENFLDAPATDIHIFILYQSLGIIIRTTLIIDATWWQKSVYVKKCPKLRFNTMEAIQIG